MSKRIEWMDYARGIGIVLVVYGHVLIGVNKAKMDVPEVFCNISDSIVYSFHMPLFILLSGLFAARWAVKTDARTALRHKAFSLLWPYLVWSLIQGSTNVFMSGHTNEAMTWQEMLRGIAVAPFGQFWFLYVLFLCHVVYLVLNKLVKPYWILIIAAALYLVHPLCTFWVTGLLFKNLVFFIVGTLLGAQTSTELFGRFAEPRAFLILALLFAAAGYLYVTILNNYVWGLVMAMLGITLSVALSMILSGTRYWGWLRMLGLYSMPIYLMHVLFTAGTRIGLSELFNMNDWIVNIAAGTVIGTFLPVVIYKLTIKLKLNTFLFGR